MSARLTPVGVARRGLALLLAAMVLTSCGSWRGIANVPLPGGPGTAPGHTTIYVQVPDTLALNVNSRVRVADVFVGSVRAIALKNWIAVVTLDLEPTVQLPANATAKIGQTSLLGSQHIELAAPPHPSPVPLKSGDTIPLKNSSAYPTIERTLASFSVILNGGGIRNLEVIQDEVLNVLDGHAAQIREFLDRLDSFAVRINQQRGELTRVLDSSNQLLAFAAKNAGTLDRVLTEFPPLLQHFAETRDLFTNATLALGQAADAVDKAVSGSAANLHQNLQLLQRPLKQLGRAAPYLVGALKFSLTAPFTTDTASKLARGDYINASGIVDLTLSAIDNGVFTGTGISGFLRALEQSWGRDPETMIPDVRFTPNPNDAPGGPLVERGE